MNDMPRLAGLYLDAVRERFAFTKSLADRAAAQLDDAAFFTEPGPGSNSVAITMKHIAGNQRSRWTDFLTTDGEKPDRHRDTEFASLGAGSPEARAALLEAWEAGWATLDSALTALTPDDLLSEVRIRTRPLSVVSAIERQLAHYAYHVGQIVYVARLLRGPDWETLSVPRGASQTFNTSMGHELPAADPDVPPTP